MEEYGYYNGIAYDARFPAKRIAALVPDGVYDQELQVVKWSGMTIRVNPGRAWQAGRFYYRDEVKELSAPAAHASLARVDAVVLRWDDLACKTEIVYVAGTPSSNPQAPALVRNETTYDFRLAEIRVPAGAGEITASMIHDTRYDAALCGVTAGFKKPDIEALMAEYTDRFLAWFGEKQQEIDDTLAVLNNANPIITVHAQKQGEGVYTATEERVKTYVPDMIWALYLDEPASGGVTVNVNNLGALAIKKVTEDGGLADPAELLPNVCNMAQYDGIQLRLLASPDASGWHRHTYTYAAKVGDTEVPIESPGGVYADDLLVLMTAGLVMQEGVDYTRGPDGSNSVSLSAPRTAAGDIYIEHFQQVSHAALGAIDGHMDSTSNPHQVTAEQVGAMAADAIQSGSNANGSWTKWPDGTMICRGVGVYAVQTSEITVVLPQAFAAADYTPVISFHWTVTAGAIGAIVGITTSGFRARVADAINGKTYENGTQLTTSYICIGRWK